MLKFTEHDREVLNHSYEEILLNLRDYLKKYNHEDMIDCSKVLIHMLHSGLFSMEGVIHFENDYDYLPLSAEISLGVHVMYGVCCCRHATTFFYDLFSILGFQSSLMYLFIDPTTGEWHRVNLKQEQANHVVILLEYLGKEYIVDPRNQFLFRKESNGKLELLNIERVESLPNYQDSNIETVGKILKKYDTYQKLGISHVYEYGYSVI